MISKRVRRSSSPQENLKQFSLNNSKGIDGTKPITDPDTVLDMENLEINPDGSLSIRKPMLSANAAYGKEHLLYDGEHVAIVYPDGLRICERGKSSPQTLDIKCSTYYTYVETTFTVIQNAASATFDFSKASFINVAGATIVGNCFVKADFLIKAGAIDATLYDEGISDKFLPRYIKLSKGVEANSWDVAIINPELTKLTTAEGEIPLNPNMCLDNPYAIRDGYGYAVPSIKGVIPYVLQDSGQVPEPPEPVDHSLTGSSYSNLPSLPDNNGDGVIDDLYIRGYLVSEFLDDDRPWGEFLTIRPYPGAEIRVKAYLEPKPFACKVSVSYINFSGTLNLTLTVRPIYDATGEPIEGDAMSPQTLTFTESAVKSPWVYVTNDDKPHHWQVMNWSYTLNWTTDTLADTVRSLHVAQLTESCKSDASFKPFAALKEGTPISWVFLKAFCDLPKTPDTYYATWDYSLDGVRWNPYGAHRFTEFPNYVWVDVLNEEWKPSESVETPSESDYVIRTYVPLNAFNADDTVIGDAATRPDILPLYIFLKELENAPDNGALLFRFSIATLKKPDNVEGEEASGNYKIVATVSQSQFTLTPDVKTTYLETDAPNAVLGEKLYYKKSIYSYGTSDYKSIVHVSDPGSFITPMYNAIDLDAYSEDIVTAVVPWRDYLLISTEKAVYLSSKTSTGFYTKLVSSSIGVDIKDSRSAVAALNGMMFKHGAAIYLAYPNLYASDDTVLMLTDISKPISHILGAVETSEPSFAIYHDDKYVLMLPDESSTRCLIYDTSEKRWSNFTYPVKFYDFFRYSENGLSTHTAVGSNFEYFIFDAPADQGLEATNGRYADVSGDTVIPIRFMLDTGQKTDSILHTKQFVETKLMFATLSDEDAFPLTLYVAIDGDPHVIRTDVSTDAPFWKTQDGLSRGVVGTVFRLGGETTPATGAFNTLRQLIVRHSGKGKSIRYVLEGDSLYNFKLYETYVRYKNLNIKQ